MPKKFAFNFVDHPNKDRSRILFIIIAFLLLFIIVFVLIILIGQKNIARDEAMEDVTDETIAEDDRKSFIPPRTEEALDILEKKSIAEEMIIRKEAADPRSEEEIAAELAEKKAVVEEMIKQKEVTDLRTTEEIEAELAEKKALAEEMIKKKRNK